MLSAVRMVVPVPKLDELTGAGNGAGERGASIGSVDRKDGVVRDVADHTAGGGTVSELERAGKDRGKTGEGIVGGDGKLWLRRVVEAVAGLPETRVGKSKVVGVAESHDAVVDDVAGDGTADGVVAEQESAYSDGIGVAGVSVVGGENGGARAELQEPAGAGDVYWAEGKHCCD